MPAWSAEIIDWISHQLAPDERVLGYSMIRGVSAAHCVIEVDTSLGKVYFKSVEARLAYELRLAAVLSSLSRAHIPRTLAFDRDRLWFLMRGVPGADLGSVREPERWIEAVQCFSDLQIKCATHIDEFLEMGCPDWRLEKISASVDDFFRDLAGLETDHSVEIEQKQSLPRLATELKDTCQRLSDFGVPLTLAHGDFHPANILATSDACVFLDWTEAYIGHPFFVLADFVAHVAWVRPDMESLAGAFEEAYLAPWREAAPWREVLSDGDLGVAFALCRPLAVLRYAMRLVQSRNLLESRTAQDKHMLVKYVNSLIRQIQLHLGVVREFQPQT